MKIVFVYPVFESLGIEYLSAYLKKYGHQTMLILDPLLFESYYPLPLKPLDQFFNYRKIILSEIIDAKPDLVCISCVSDYFNWSIKIAEDIKAALDVPIVFGGPHPTAVPDNVLQHPFVDFVIAGEGEEALSELVNNLENRRGVLHIKNLCYKFDGKVIKNPLRSLISDLDSLPFPDKGLYYKERHKFIDFMGSDSYLIMGSRGCPYSCSYCHNSFLRKIYKDSNYLRFRSPDNIIEELLVAKQKYKFRRVAFCDDALICYDNKEWLKELLKRYKKEISLPFYCCVHPSMIDAETVCFLEEAGCRTLQMGIQTLNEGLRKNILLRFGANNDIIRAIRLIAQSKIFLSVGLMLGLPTESRQDLLITSEFFNKYKVDSISAVWLRHYPKTEVTRYLDKETVDKINQGIIYAPVTTNGTTFDKDKAPLVNLILLANFIPNFILRFILRKKLYRFFPRINLHYPNLILSAIVAKMLSPGKYIYPRFQTFIDQLRYHEYYVTKYFFQKFKKLSRRLSILYFKIFSL